MVNAKERMEKKIKRRGSKVRTCQGRDEKRIRNKIQREEKGKKRMKETDNCIIVFFLLDGSPASEFYVPTFRNTVFHLHRWCKQDEFLQEQVSLAAVRHPSPLPPPQHIQN